MKHNKEPFHIQHGLTVEKTMRWFARELGYGEEEEYWGLQDCCTTLILKCIRKNTAKKPLNC